VSYRDDHAAAVSRADALDRENAALRDETQRLAAELAAASEWLGGPRKRLFVGAAAVLGAVALAAGALVLGRATASCPDCTRVAPPRPQPMVLGAIVADGAQLGHWILSATRCVARSDGIQLTAVGSEDHGIWLTNNVTDVETPLAAISLDEHKHCQGKLKRQVVRVSDTPAEFDGHIELDCTWGENRIQGRIEFRRCR
jgi:hypothetical protein